MSIEFYLPFPPSVNSKYGISKGKRFKSKKDKEWELLASCELNKQNVQPIKERCFLIFELYHPDNRERDDQNYVKKPTDLLVSKGILQGDSRRYIKGTQSYWNDKKGKIIKVKIITVDEFDSLYHFL